MIIKNEFILKIILLKLYEIIELRDRGTDHSPQEVPGK